MNPHDAPPAHPIPWLAFAGELRDELLAGGRAGIDALDLALAWASGAMPIPHQINLLCGPNPLREVHEPADALNRRRDTVLKVGLLHALESSFAASGLDEVQGMKALRQQLADCPQPVPAGLRLPWASEVPIEFMANTDRWLNALGFEHGPQRPGPLPRWNNALAVCALDHLAKRVQQPGGLRQELLNGQTLTERYCHGAGGKLIDSNSTAPADLHCQPWLAQLLKLGQAEVQTGPPTPWWTLRFNSLKHLGGAPAGTARTDGLKTTNKTGLKIANLYYAALIERLWALGQPAHASPAAPSALPADQPRVAQDIDMNRPQRAASDLPAELQGQLPAGLHRVAPCSVFALGQNLNGVLGLGTSTSGLIPTWSGPSQQVRMGALKTRRAPISAASDNWAKALWLLHPTLLQLREGLDPSQFASVCLDPLVLSPGRVLAWLDVTVLVRHAGRWHVLPIELEDDESDPTRLGLRPLMPWPAGLPADNDHHLLARLAAAMPRAVWATELVGAGAFVCAAVPMD